MFRLSDVEKVAHLLYVGFVDDAGVVEVSLTFCGFFGQDVAVVSVFALNLAGAGQSETFFRGGVGFYFWHFSKI